MLQLDIANPQFSFEYSKEFQNSLQREESMHKQLRSEGVDCAYPNQHCLATQVEINERMRKVLIDWLVEVHLNFKLLPETLFIAINMIDRYSQKE